MDDHDGTLVVGGGLAGLTTAALLAREGEPVRVLEQASTLGGRARTREIDGYRFNQGGHALYPTDPGTRVLDELGVDYPGGPPPVEGGVVVRGGEIHRMPTGLVSLLFTGAFPWRAKLEMAGFLAGLPGLDVDELGEVPLADWLEERFSTPGARDFVEATTRIGTYSDRPEAYSAAAGLSVLRDGFEDPVVYLDEGWQVLVDQLASRATEHGAHLETEARVEAVEPTSDGFTVHQASGKVHAPRVVLALPPNQAREILAVESRLDRWADELEPVEVASLDVAFEQLPRPEQPFAVSLDEPIFLTVQSINADLAPPGGDLAHVTHYLPEDPAEPERQREAMAALLDRVQPGWRDAAAHVRFLPRMTVTHATPTASLGGRSGRPGPEVPGIEDLFVAGDWVGPTGHLGGAALSSAGQVAAEITEGRLAETAQTSVPQP